MDHCAAIADQQAIKALVLLRLECLHRAGQLQDGFGLGFRARLRVVVAGVSLEDHEREQDGERGAKEIERLVVLPTSPAKRSFHGLRRAAHSNATDTTATPTTIPACVTRLTYWPSADAGGGNPRTDSRSRPSRFGGTSMRWFLQAPRPRRASRWGGSRVQIFRRARSMTVGCKHGRWPLRSGLAGRHQRQVREPDRAVISRLLPHGLGDRGPGLVLDLLWVGVDHRGDRRGDIPDEGGELFGRVPLKLTSAFSTSRGRTRRPPASRQAPRESGVRGDRVFPAEAAPHRAAPSRSSSESQGTERDPAVPRS